MKRRISLLEGTMYGYCLPEIGEVLLIRCYLDAHKAPSLTDPLAERAWVRQAYLLDTRVLIRLGRLLNDPFPFRPFLAALDHCRERGVQGAEEAAAHLESVCRDFLDAAGLELLDPRDVMGKLRLSEALENLS
jgi:hypothetical protein